MLSLICCLLLMLYLWCRVFINCLSAINIVFINRLSTINNLFLFPSSIIILVLLIVYQWLFIINIMCLLAVHSQLILYILSMLLSSVTINILSPIIIFYLWLLYSICHHYILSLIIIFIYDTDKYLIVCVNNHRGIFISVIDQIIIFYPDLLIVHQVK